MKITGIISTILLVALLVSCKSPTAKKEKLKLDSIRSLSISAIHDRHFCSLTLSDFALEIDSCECSDINTNYDTITVTFSIFDRNPQGHFLKIYFPDCENSYIIKHHQNRLYIPCMGPDPVLDDWLHYISPSDTIPYDSKNEGFYIDTIPETEQIRFPKFDTIEFFKAYCKWQEKNWEEKPLPSNKDSLNLVYHKNKNLIKNLLEIYGVELDKIILTIIKDGSTVKVIVFVAPHMG